VREEKKKGLHYMLPSVACDSRERKFYSDVSFVLFPMTMREQLANLPGVGAGISMEEHNYLEWLYEEATRLGDELDLWEELLSVRKSAEEHAINCQETYDTGEVYF
jgi:hypothetical protein